MYQQIEYTVEDPVARITFNRPDQLNAFTTRMLAEIRHAIAAAEQDERVVAIVLTGAGRGFCAGMDMNALNSMASGGAGGPDDLAALAATPGNPEAGDFQVAFGYLLAVRKPILAAVNGPCAGLGMCIALLADMRFVERDARFVTAFAQRGLIAEHGISWLLPRIVGPSRALDLLWSARRVDADEALRIGLADRVVDAGGAVEAATHYARELAARCSPTSLMVMKQQVWRQLGMPFGEALRDSNRVMADSLQRDDFKEGVRSFLEKRPPRFRRIGKA